MSDLPTIKLGGVSFPVKELVIAQLEIVVPTLMRLGGVTMQTMTTDNWRDLTEVIYQAIAPGQTPPMKRDDFKALPATPYEMMAAIDVILQQSGMVRKANVPGEAPAGENPPTGEKS